VAYSFFAIFFLFSLFKISDIKLKPYQKWALLCVTILAIPVCAAESLRIDKKQQETVSTVKLLQKNFKGKTLVFLGRSFNFDNLNPFYNPFPSDCTYFPYLLSWISQSPINKAILEKSGQKTIEEALLKPNDFYLLLHKDDFYVIKPLERFYSRHYGLNVQLSKVNDLCGEINAYKLARAVDFN
jgi:hypothetical protein